jgi:hypothetical protein
MVDYDEHADHDYCFVTRDRFPCRVVLVLVIGFGVGFAAMACAEAIVSQAQRRVLD